MDKPNLTLIRNDRFASEPATSSLQYELGSGDQSLESQVHRKLDEAFKYNNIYDTEDLYEKVMEHMERPLIQQVLQRTRYNQVRAAKILGINRNTLRKKIRTLGIEVHRGR